MGNNLCGCRDRLDDEIPGEDQEAISPPWLLRYEGQESPHLKQVRLLTYNIFVRPPPVNNYGDDFKSERLVEFIKRFPEFDIICLQEMFTKWTSRREKLKKIAKQAGFKFSAESPLPAVFSTAMSDGGLLTLSRYPILNTEFRPYPQGIGPDFIVLKGVLYTKIKVNRGVMHVFSTHTQASYSTEVKYLLSHVEQLICFRKFLEEMLTKNQYKMDDMVLLVGDFNVDPRDNIPHDTQTLKKLCPDLLRYSNLTSKETFSEYEMLQSILSDDLQDDLEELYYSQHGEHPITFGDYYIDENEKMQPVEKVLTLESLFCSNKRLDFIFKFTPRSIILNQEQQNSADITGKEQLPLTSRFVVKEKSAALEKFEVTEKPFTQLSDHYGVKVTIQVENGTFQQGHNESQYTTSSASPEK